MVVKDRRQKLKQAQWEEFATKQGLSKFLLIFASRTERKRTAFNVQTVEITLVPVVPESGLYCD